MANNTDYTRLLDGYSLLAIKAWAEGKFAPIASPTFTGTVTLPTSVKIGSYTSTGLVKYTNGVLSIDATPYLSSETWRPIQVAGVQKLSSSTSSGALNFLNGTHSVQFTYNSGLYAEVDLSKYKPNGTNAFLGSGNKIDTVYLPDSVLGQLVYKGTWDATSQTSSGTPSSGWYYICSVAGNRWPDGTAATNISFNIGDWAIYTGSGTTADPYRWEKVDNTDAITGIKLTSSGSTLTGLVTIPLASSNDFGIIKLGYSASGKNYPVQLDSNGKAYVNVPWTDNNYYHTRVYSTGLKISTGTGVSDMYVPTATASVLGVVMAAAVRSSAITSTTGGTTSGRYYGVELDSSGKMFVNVPWTSNTDHYPTTFTWTNGTSSGPTGSLTGNSGFTAVSFGAIPSASATQSGVVTTTDQSFAGIKTFADGFVLKSDSTSANDIYITNDPNDGGYLVIQLTTSRGTTTYELVNDDDGGGHYIATQDWVNDNYALGTHTHILSIASDSGTNQLTLAYGTKYKLTAGGSTFIFTMPASDNTDHYPTTFTWTNGTTDGPTGSLTGNSGFTAVSFGAIPSASATQSGVVTTGTQTFAGNKTLAGNLEIKKAGTSDNYIRLWNKDNTHSGYLGADTTGLLTMYNGSQWEVLATRNWVTNNDKDHYPTTFTWTAGSAAGPTGSLTGNSGFTAVSFAAIPSASSSASGVVTTGAQSFAGIKTFNDNIFISESALGIGNSDDSVIICLHNDNALAIQSADKFVNINTYSQTEATNILNGLNSDGTSI